jgi:hypothetical protein
LEYDRLDKMFNSLWPKMQKGDCQAISTGLSIMTRRARLQGIDLADTDAPPVGPMVLNINPVLVTRDSLEKQITNGTNGTLEGSAAASGSTKVLPK